MRLIVVIFFVLVLNHNSTAQNLQDVKLDPVKVEKFGVYVKYKHSYGEGFESWKENNKILYVKEMWYYTESFYIKRDHFTDGLVLNEEIIDVSRWESQRKLNEEVFIRIVGFKDALVLIPGKDLLYKPN